MSGVCSMADTAPGAVQTNASKIVSDPAVMAGEPVIDGIRITVELILEKLAAGETEAQVLDACPHLGPDAVRAALAFGARALKADVVYPHRTAWRRTTDLGADESVERQIITALPRARDARS